MVVVGKLMVVPDADERELLVEPLENGIAAVDPIGLAMAKRTVRSASAAEAVRVRPVRDRYQRSMSG
jgi:hypothetical protein